MPASKTTMNTCKKVKHGSVLLDKKRLVPTTTKLSKARTNKGMNFIFFFFFTFSPILDVLLRFSDKINGIPIKKSHVEDNVIACDTFVTNWPVKVGLFYNGLCRTHSVCRARPGVVPRFRYFPNFSVLLKHTLPIEYRVCIWQVSPQLSCGGTCQI